MRRWEHLDARDVLDVVEVLVLEELRHAAVAGLDWKPLPDVPAGIPFATPYGYVLLPVDGPSVDEESWGAEPDAWQPPDEEDGQW